MILHHSLKLKRSRLLKFIPKEDKNIHNVSILADDDLVLQGARASAVMILTWFAWNNMD